MLPDPATPYGEAVRRRLREERAVWLTTVNSSGVPQPNPVWFVWEEDEGDPWGDGSFLIYHLGTAARRTTLSERPAVALHFDGSGSLEVMVFTGEVEILKDAPLAHEVPEYAAKYAEMVAFVTKGAESLPDFMAKYSIASRIRPTKVRGF